MIWKEKLSIFMLIFGVLYINAVVGIKSRNTRYYAVDGKMCLQDKNFLVSPGHVFGCCNVTSHELLISNEQIKSGLTCTFVMETSKHIYFPNYICTFSIKSTNIHSYFEFTSVFAIDKDKAILRLGQVDNEDKYSRFFILHFADDCRVVEANVPGVASNEYIQFYAATDNKFDVTSKLKDGYFRAIFDTEGNIVTESQLWLPDSAFDYHFDPKFMAVARNPAGGRLVVGYILVIDKSDDDDDDDENDDSQIQGVKTLARVYMVDDNGSIEILRDYPTDSSYIEGSFYPPTKVSMTYNLVTVCSKLNMTLTCAQFDLAGRLKFETKVSLKEYRKISLLRVHNLPQGGFLLAIDNCPRISPNNCSTGGTFLDMKKFDDTGEFLATLRLRSYSDIGNMHVYVNEKNAICLSSANMIHKIGKFKLINVCLPDEDYILRIMWPYDF